jgi:hypothetical protein
MADFGAKTVSQLMAAVRPPGSRAALGESADNGTRLDGLERRDGVEGLFGAFRRPRVVIVDRDRALFCQTKPTVRKRMRSGTLLRSWMPSVPRHHRPRACSRHRATSRRSDREVEALPHSWDSVSTPRLECRSFAPRPQSAIVAIGRERDGIYRAATGGGGARVSPAGGHDADGLPAVRTVGSRRLPVLEWVTVVRHGDRASSEGSASKLVSSGDLAVVRDVYISVECTESCFRNPMVGIGSQSRVSSAPGAFTHAPCRRRGLRINGSRIVAYTYCLR